MGHSTKYRTEWRSIPHRRYGDYGPPAIASPYDRQGGRASWAGVSRPRECQPRPTRRVFRASGGCADSLLLQRRAHQHAHGAVRWKLGGDRAKGATDRGEGVPGAPQDVFGGRSHGAQHRHDPGAARYGRFRRSASPGRPVCARCDTREGGRLRDRGRVRRSRHPRDRGRHDASRRVPLGAGTRAACRAQSQPRSCRGPGRRRDRAGRVRIPSSRWGTEAAIRSSRLPGRCFPPTTESSRPAVEDATVWLRRATAAGFWREALVTTC